MCLLSRQQIDGDVESVGFVNDAFQSTCYRFGASVFVVEIGVHTIELTFIIMLRCLQLIFCRLDAFFSLRISAKRIVQLSFDYL